MTDKAKVVRRLLNEKKIYHLVIEGHDYGQMQELFEEVQNKWSLYDNCVLEEAGVEDTIIDYDDGRCEETGRLGCMTKEEYDKVIKSGK